jgi:voltage-gated potassium channel
MGFALHDRRYSLFLFSFVLMLFGDIFTKPEYDYDAQTILILQNMLFSLLLFRRKHKVKRLVVISLIVLGTFARIYNQLNPDFTGVLFLIIYMFYFLLISHQIYIDLMQQKDLGIEMISAAFSGYILLGTVFSALFITMGYSGAFKVPDHISNSDYLYFSFVTLLTIGYGDITPVTEIAKKVVVLLGLMGNFYTVFVIGIIIGKFLNSQNIDHDAL